MSRTSRSPPDQARRGRLVRAFDSLVEAKRVATLGHPTIVEAALAEFLGRGYFEPHLSKLQAELDRRYLACLEGLRATMPEGVKWSTPGGGPVLWLQFPEQVDVKRLARQVGERGVHVALASDAFFGEPHLRGIRLGYAFPSQADLATGISIVADEVRRQMRQG